MGCDIHIVVEHRKSNGRWIGLWSSDRIPKPWPIVAQRDYAFFTELAAVRGRSPTSLYPRNVPEDVSALAWAEYMTCPTDHHSASHLSVGDFCDAWLRSNPDNKTIRAEFAAFDLLGIDYDPPEYSEYRVVFWFDN